MEEKILKILSEHGNYVINKFVFEFIKNNLVHKYELDDTFMHTICDLYFVSDPNIKLKSEYECFIINNLKSNRTLWYIDCRMKEFKFLNNIYTAFFLYQNDLGIDEKLLIFKGSIEELTTNIPDYKLETGNHILTVNLFDDTIKMYNKKTKKSKVIKDKRARLNNEEKILYLLLRRIGYSEKGDNKVFSYMRLNGFDILLDKEDRRIAEYAIDDDIYYSEKSVFVSKFVSDKLVNKILTSNNCVRYEINGKIYLGMLEGNDINYIKIDGCIFKTYVSSTSNKRIPKEFIDMIINSDMISKTNPLF